jgi:YebC/PmpR family DNA-binding regulatory protein
MGAQWKQAGREAAAQKKGQLISKLVREIVIAAKLGGADPDLNARLAAAVNKARKASVTRDTIERAVKKGSGQTDETVNFETLLYEGFAPHKVPVIVECLTDNRNRTAPDIRNLFKAGTLGQPGSMAFFFDRWGVVEATHADGRRDAEADAIEAGAQNVEPLEPAEPGQTGARFLTDGADLDLVTKRLREAGWTITVSELGYVARNEIDLPPGQRAEVEAFLEAFDDNDDVHRIWTALR